MKGQQLQKWGIPEGPVAVAFLERIEKLRAEGLEIGQVEELYRRIGENPEDFFDDDLVGDLARELSEAFIFRERDEPAPFKKWGRDLDPAAVQQMRNACRLPVSFRGAIMPDAHRGYGLPIGGVLATEGAVIPYAVGVDIACRMKLSVVDLPVEAIDSDIKRLSRALEEETRFGVGAHFDKPHDHEVMDEDWDVSPVTKKNKDRGRRQLGSSGGGNHFAEFGILTLSEPDLGLEAGTYLALLTHSGSRGPGSAVANHYSKLARQLHPGLPDDLGHLAWLDLDTDVGQEYWAAMELMGKFASANHAVMHREIAARLGASVIAGVENHHNYAWKEVHDGREMVVHRKGATPAGKGVLGVIPGSMTEPAFVVRGKGEALSLESAAHGAGRVMSRRQAHRAVKWDRVNSQLKANKVTLLSADLDEAPDVYKDIEEVMEDQQDLVEVVASFQPRIVKMAPAEGRRGRGGK